MAVAIPNGNPVSILEHMSLEQRKAYNEKLMHIARGEALPNRTIPVEYMFHDLWRDMRSHDAELADDILEPMFVLMCAQTDKVRKDMADFGQYLRYRESWPRRRSDESLPVDHGARMGVQAQAPVFGAVCAGGHFQGGHALFKGLGVPDEWQ